MKVFDWDTCSGSKERKEYLLQNHCKKVSEEDFLKGYSELREYSTSKRILNKKYSPSAIKKEYRSLVNKFGFFQGV